MLPIARDMDAAAQRDLVVQAIETIIVDVPTLRQHKLSQTSVTAQNYVLVRLRLAGGAEGIGEAATLGGPRWSEESVEAIKANIDAYLGPAIQGMRADLFEEAGRRMDLAAKRNNAAKGAVETALFDAVGKALGVPASTLLGGAVRDRIPVLWTLASGDVGQEIEEAREKLHRRLHRTFKVKIGAAAPEVDLDRMRRLVDALAGRAEFIVDANQAWDEAASARCLPVLRELGVRLVEQPVPAWNVPAMARLRQRPDVPPLLADESVFDAHDMLRVASAGAADAVSLKIVKHAGLLGTRKVAAVAEAAGIGLYGGCLLESSVGAAAHLQVFSTFRDLAWGCEHFGPQILREDLVREPLHFADFHVHIPSGPGLGVLLDEGQIDKFARR
ncbi:mandelate racemase [Methylobacterium aquaticum]|uniref:Mandelate racemase n=2 Tax=Methylobacterium aquaticum TaxID=270351 RepID=A0A0J6SQ50_9HYPH|nr:mandelate racemase [Methylobacterium aquaticum]